MPGHEGQEPPFSLVSLRFRNSLVEAGYAGGRQKLLVRRSRLLAVVHLLASCSTLLFILAMQQHRRELVATDIAHEAYMVQAVGASFLMAICLAFLVVTQLCSERYTMGRPVLLEAFVVSSMALSMTSTALLGPKRYVKFRGYSLTEAFADGYGSDSELLLSIDVFVTIAHLGLPIRWFVMAPLELLAVLFYAFVVLTVGSDEPPDHVFSNSMLLVSLVVATTLNKRFHELDERKAFLAVISEKALRCEAEFQLSQVSSSLEVRTTRSARSSARSSEAVTDRSGAIFELFEKGADRREQLRLVAEKGDSEHWRLPASDVLLLDTEVLGSGSFGCVRRALFCGMLAAVKSPRLELGQLRVADLCNELRVLRHLRHPHIIAVHGCVVLPEEQQIYLVLELIEGPTLTAFVLPAKGGPGPTALQRYQVMLGVCQALVYMHTRVPHVVHGDLKSDNIMVELAGNRAVPKVLDFGLSRIVTAQVRDLGGTLAWVAPEVLSRAPVRCSADVFSFGHVLAFAACGVLPTRGISVSRILRNLQVWRPPRPIPSLQPLVRACLRPQPELRPCIRELHKALLGLSRDLQPPDEPEVLRLRRLAELMDAGPLDLLAVSTQQPQASRLEPLPEGEVCVEEPVKKGADSCSGSMEAEDPRRGRQEEPPQPFPELMETSKAAMQAMLIDCFRRWNSRGLRVRCCWSHAWFRLCRDVCDECLRLHCGPLKLPPREGRQCPHCGVLELKASMCDLCGWQEESAVHKLTL